MHAGARERLTFAQAACHSGEMLATPAWRVAVPVAVGAAEVWVESKMQTFATGTQVEAGIVVKSQSRGQRQSQNNVASLGGICA